MYYDCENSLRHDTAHICTCTSSVVSYITNQWVPEITHHCQKTPFLLVGTKIDLRVDDSTIEKLAKYEQKPVNSDQGERLARQLRAVKYVECSALTKVRKDAHVNQL